MGINFKIHQVADRLLDLVNARVAKLNYFTA
jgi:hypothetical protein